MEGKKNLYPKNQSPALIKKYKYRMVDGGVGDKTKRMQADGWKRGCSIEEKKKYGDKRYMGTDQVLMKKEVL